MEEVFKYTFITFAEWKKLLIVILLNRMNSYCKFG
jgi:hypothetical protein